MRDRDDAEAAVQFQNFESSLDDRMGVSIRSRVVAQRLAKASGCDFQPRTVVSALEKKIMQHIINAVGRSGKNR
jgi:hypothetical protein